MRRLMLEERGAAAVYALIVLLFFGIGTAALVVDLGDVFWERRMQQNSADAAALAVAIDCAQGNCGDYRSVAETYASENNRRGAFVESVVGPGGAAPTFAGGEVTVITRTGSTAEPGRLTQFFSGIFGYEEGLASGARAKAIWGVPEQAVASPLSVSICAWDRLTDIESFPPDPVEVEEKLPSILDVEKDIAAGNFGEVIFYLDSLGEGPDADDECNAPPGFYTDPDDPDAKLPAAFGWLDSDDCVVPVRTDTDGDQWAPAKPGTALGGEGGCVKDVRNDDPPVTVFPIFVGVNEGNVGSPDEYQLVAPAGFYLTGFRLPGAGPPAWSLPGSSAPCSAPATCIRGFFIKKTELAPPVDEPTFGLVSIRLQE